MHVAAYEHPGAHAPKDWSRHEGEVSDWQFVPMVEIEIAEPLLTDAGGGRTLDDIYLRSRWPTFTWTRSKAIAHHERATRAERERRERMSAHDLNMEVGWNKVPWDLDTPPSPPARRPYVDLTREEIEEIGLAAMARYGLG